MDQITEALYEQSMDAQEGVIYFLLDQMADQHVKEAAVAYFVLLFSGACQGLSLAIAFFAGISISAL